MSRLVATRLVAAATPVVAPVLRSAPRASPLARTVQAHASVQSRRFSSASTEETAGKVYQTLFKSNRMYITYIVGGSIVLSYVGNSVFDGLWAKMNEGRTFESTDWSKFEAIEEDDEDEDEDDDDDDDDE